MSSVDIRANNYNQQLDSQVVDQPVSTDPKSVQIPQGLDENGQPYYENPEPSVGNDGDKKALAQKVSDSQAQMEKMVTDPNYDPYVHRDKHGEAAKWGFFKKLWEYVINHDESMFPKETRSVIDFMVHKFPTITAYLASGVNVVGGAAEFLGLSEKNRKYIEDMCSWMIKFSFFPYGLSGVINGIQKKNPYQAVAFLGEPFFALCGTLKDIYVLRGLPTGLDQIPVATEKITKKIFGSSAFPTWMDGVKEVPRACWKLIKEIGSWIKDKVTSPVKAFKALVSIIKDPKSFLKTYEAKGHSALISSIGSMAAATGYIMTGNENIFGPLRDLSGPFIDWEMLMGKTLREKIAGIFFILESMFDFGARYVPKHLRLALNLMSHACGRFALEQYKETYADTMREEQVGFRKEKRLERLKKKQDNMKAKEQEAMRILAAKKAGPAGMAA